MVHHITQTSLLAHYYKTTGKDEDLRDVALAPVKRAPRVVKLRLTINIKSSIISGQRCTTYNHPSCTWSYWSRSSVGAR